MVQDVFGTISEYWKMVSDLGWGSAGDTRIIFKSDGRIYSTSDGAAPGELNEEDVVDITAAAEDTGKDRKAALDTTKQPEGAETFDELQIPGGNVTVHDEAKVLAASKVYSAVVVARPPYTSILIESSHEIKAVLDDMAQIAGPEIRIVPHEAKKIKRAIAKANAVMTDDGYLLLFGRTLFEAYTLLTVVEKSAETVLKAQVIGGAKPISHMLARHMHRVYMKKYSKNLLEEKAREESGATEAEAANAAAGEKEAGSAAGEKEAANAGSEGAETAGQAAGEHDLRKALADYGRKLVESGLVQGTWGNLSVRKDDKEMICTPSGLDYEDLGPDDMVCVNIKTLKESGKNKATSEKSMHSGIYRGFSGAGAVIHTHSKYVSIFAASEMPLQVEDLGKYADLGEIINISKYALAGTSTITKNAIRALGASKGALLSHHGMVCYGKDLEEAFRIAGEIEEAAREYIDKRWE